MPSPSDAVGRSRRSAAVVSAFTLIAVLAFAASVLIIFRSENQTGDSLDYARSIRTGEALFHPHHLLFNPIVRVVWIGLKVFFPGISPIAAAQVHNIFWALIVLTAVFGIIRRMAGSAAAAAVGTLALFSVLGFWQYATFAEVYLPTIGCLAVILALLHGVRRSAGLHPGGNFPRTHPWIQSQERVRQTEGSPLAIPRLDPPTTAAAPDISRGATSAVKARPLTFSLSLMIVALFALAVLYDQMSVFFAFPLVVLLAARFGKKRIFRVAGLMMASGLTVLAAYTAAFLTTSNPKTVSGFVHWCFSYAFHPDPSWGSWSNVSLLGVAKILLSFARNIMPIPRAFFLPAIIVSGLVLAILVLSALRAIIRRAPDRDFRLSFLLWIGSTTAFMWWFCPSGYELSIPLLIPFHFLAIHLILDVGVTAANSRKTPRLTMALASAAVTGLFVLNLFTAVLPAHTDRGDAYKRAVRIQNSAPAEAVVIADYFLRENLRYYFDRPKTLENTVILFSFFRNLKLPPEYILEESRPVLVPIAFIRPESEAAKPFQGDNHPREWRTFIEWLLGCEHRDGRVIAARDISTIEALSDYVLLSGERRPTDGLADLFRRLDGAVHGSAADSSEPFSNWLTRHPDLGR